MGYINKELVLSGLNLRLLRLKCEHENVDKINELENVIGAISETETENVAPVINAKWIEFPVNRFSRCSNCGFESTWDYTSVKNWNYCPNCRAKMDKE